MSTIVEKRFVDDPPDRLRAMLNRMRPRLRRRFLAVMDRLQDSLPLKQLAQWIQTGRVDLALGVVERAAATFAAEVGHVYVGAGVDTAKFLTEALDVLVDFDQTNFRAVNAMQANRLRLIREFTAAQRRAVNEALVQGITEGLNPVDTARRFRQSIGLTERQMASVANYRKLLQEGDRAALRRALRDARHDSVVENSIRTNEPLTKKQVDVMVERYRERYIAYRARTIARTEAMDAANAASHEVYLQLADAGTVELDDLEQTWNTAKDNRVRDPAHTAMHGQKRKVGELFVSGLGNLLRRPGDPNAPAEERINCRCAVGVRVRMPEAVTRNPLSTDRNAR